MPWALYMAPFVYSPSPSGTPAWYLAQPVVGLTVATACATRSQRTEVATTPARTATCRRRWSRRNAGGEHRMRTTIPAHAYV